MIARPRPAYSSGAGVTAEVTRRASVKTVDSYPPDCAGFCPQRCHPGPGLPPPGLMWLVV